METLFEEIKRKVVGGKHKEIEGLVQKAIAGGLDLDLLINQSMIAAMDIVGQQFSASRIFVPEMLASAATMKKGLDLIKPLLKAQGGQSKGKILLCTVKGDMHDIGKNLVGMMLEGAGFEVLDLGVDATVEKVVATVQERQPEVVGLSALLTTTMPEMEKVIHTLDTKGMRARVKIMVGGAPVDAKFAHQIGADAHGQDAAQAVQIARSFVEGRNSDDI